MATLAEREVAEADESGPLPKIVTQATPRLELTSVTLDGIRMPMILEHPDQLDEWLYAVRMTLKKDGIQKLADPEVPRPYRSNAAVYGRWLTLSKAMAIWLAAGVEPEFLAKINPRKRNLQYADDFIEHLATVLRNHRTHEELNKVFDFLTTKSSNYLSALDFVHDFHSQFYELRGQGINVSPYEALCSLMWQVKLAGHEELYKSMITKLRAEADKLERSTVMQTFTFDKFSPTCDEVIYQLVHGGPPPEIIPPGTKKNAPAAGVHIATHLRFWEESVMQRDGSNMCFFCGEHPHDVAQCWYLHPRFRPADWIPSPQIWIFREGVTNGHMRVGHGIQGPPSSPED